MRIETLMDERGSRVELYGDFSAAIQVHKRIAASGAVLEGWIGTWVDPQGVHVDLFDGVPTLKAATQEAVHHVMFLWEQHVRDHGDEQDLRNLVAFDAEVTRTLGLSSHAIEELAQQISERLRLGGLPYFEGTVPC